MLSSLLPKARSYDIMSQLDCVLMVVITKNNGLFVYIRYGPLYLRNNSALARELCSAVGLILGTGGRSLPYSIRRFTVTSCCRFEYLNFLFHTFVIMGLEWSVLSSKVNIEIFCKTGHGVEEACCTKNIHSAGN